MRIIWSIALSWWLFLTIGCGTKERSGNDAVGSNQSDKSSTSMLVEEKAVLPQCESSRNGNLAYVKSEAKFYVCDGTAWSQAELASQKGEKGEKGEKGDTLVRESSSSIWLDPITSIKWAIAGFNLNWIDANKACSGGWRLPSHAELQKAAQDGIFTATGSHAGYETTWTVDEDPNQPNYAIAINIQSQNGTSRLKSTTSYGVLCITK